MRLIAVVAAAAMNSSMTNWYADSRQFIVLPFQRRRHS